MSIEDLFQEMMSNAQAAFGEHWQQARNYLPAELRKMAEHLQRIADNVTAYQLDNTQGYSPDTGKLMLKNGNDLWFYDPANQASVRISPDQRLLGQAANGDVVTSPFASGNDFTSPVLLAASTSVSPRVGSVTTIEDDPLSPVPNCQRTASPL